VVGIVIDQNTAADQGVLVDFFGKPARTTPVAALLARRRDIPVLPAFSRRLPDGRHLLAILPPLPLEKILNGTWSSRAGPSRPGCAPHRRNISGCTAAGRTSSRRSTKRISMVFRQNVAVGFSLRRHRLESLCHQRLF